VIAADLGRMRGGAWPAAGAFDLGGQREQDRFPAGTATSCTDTGSPAAVPMGTLAAGNPAMFHTPVIGANMIEAATLRSHDPSPSAARPDKGGPATP